MRHIGQSLRDVSSIRKQLPKSGAESFRIGLNLMSPISLLFAWPIPCPLQNFQHFGRKEIFGLGIIRFHSRMQIDRNITDDLTANLSTGLTRVTANVGLLARTLS